MAYVEAFCLLFFIIFLFHWIKRSRIGLNEPPLVPYRYPIIGHTYRILYDAENFLKECKEKYGEPFSLYVFGSVTTFTGVDSTPEVLGNSDVFNFNSGKMFPIDVFKKFTGHTPSNIPRVVHEQVSGKISVYTSRMQKELVSGIENFIGDCKEPKVIGNIQETILRIVAKPIANVILGDEGAKFEDIIVSFISFITAEREIEKMVSAPGFLLCIHPSIYKFITMIPLKFGWNPLTQHRDLFVQLCKPIIEERICQRKQLGEKYIQKDDLLDFFLSDSGTDVIDNNLLDHLFGDVYKIVFAAINSTSRTLSFALFDYGGRPELWNELYEEQLKIHNESNGYLSTEDVNKKMVKLDCFLKESFRFSLDIAALPHTVVGDSYTFSNGTTVPKDRDIYVYSKDVAFNNKFFGETSNEFQPKRHITSFSNGKTVHSPATKVDRSFITFGGGRHACPGRFFAVNEIKMCLHKLILKYNIRTESGKIVSPITKSFFKVAPSVGLTFENRN
ncbi:cytochrome P450 [Gigaspora rosea]|uniref:Cytochrome P450 n=1 Tax=Gigaspora rosea TaxID=44941 RepID=A0A397VST5_9GLOM|nr:cytochrome P450 [Gigaspora rosea]